MKLSLEDLRALPQQKARLSFKESLAINEVVKPVLADLLVQANASGLRISGRVQTLLKLMCHSCLGPYFQALNFELNEVFVYEHYLSDAEPEQGGKELQSGDFVESVPYKGNIDISDVVYQAVTLATPVFCSCGEECPGPPAYPAKDLAANTSDGAAEGTSPGQGSIDPRWQNLKTLFPKEESC